MDMTRNEPRVKLSRERKLSIVKFETESGTKLTIQTGFESNVLVGMMAPDLTVYQNGQIVGKASQIWGLDIVVEGGVWRYHFFDEPNNMFTTDKIKRGSLTVQ